jgi:hypothetical protein
MRSSTIPKNKFRVSKVLIFVLLGLAVFLTPDFGVAQEPYRWTVPKQIPDYFNFLEPPIMVADSNRTVHAFNLENQDNTYTIVYRQWSIANGWTLPVEVLLPEFLGLAPSLLDVILDESGYINLIYFAGGRDSGSIFFTRSLAVYADDAAEWSKPEVVTSDAGPLPSGKIIELHNSELAVVFSGNRYGNGVYETIFSSREGVWTTPNLVHRSMTEDFFPGGIDLVYDPDGYIHVVWDYSDDSGLAKTTWYARRNIGLGEWESIQELSHVDNDLEYSGQASIIKAEGILIVVYYDDFPPTRFIRTSGDNGDTWSSEFRPFPHRGGYGNARLVKDSRGTIHMIIGNRIQSPEIHGMWYSRFVDDTWLPLTPITSGLATDSYDPTQPRAVVVQGNVLLAAWSNDVRSEFRTGAWYSYTFLDAPELPVKTLPESGPFESPDEPNHKLATTVPTETSIPVLPGRSAGSSSTDRLDALSGNPATLIFIGVFPVMILVAGALVRRMRHR